MQRKLVGYFFLAFFSFCFFTGTFHAIANAETINQTATPITPTIVSPLVSSPTPTIDKAQAAVSQQSQAQISVPTPTEAVKEEVLASSTKAINTPAATKTSPTPTPEPTVIPTPLPTAVPQPVVVGPAELDGWFNSYGSQYNVDANVLRKIAKCESGFNPTSNNSGMYLGMFQFSASTWSANRNRMGLDPNPDLRTNPEEAIKTAAYVISKAGTGAWPVCGK